MSKTIGYSLKAIGVDFLRKENTFLHHTNKYKNDSLIVRRGQEFQLKVSFTRDVKDSDKIFLQFSTGEKPVKSNGTLLHLNTRSGQNDQGWHGKICQTSGKECLIAVTSPADAIVGKYVLDVITESNIYHSGKNDLYVLFNPWCEADSVFMPDDAQKAEYVLNTTGYQYCGPTEYVLSRSWHYGQFEEDILDCCMYLLHRSKLGPNDQRDPIMIARAMSALVNMSDDDGVIHGKWTEGYEGGTSPADWRGSVRILQQYYRTKKPVFYGQCWIFSGVLTTVMRCLGIPARSVTTTDSAHDTEKNINVDIYFNEKKEQLPSEDFIWNFHVWNDVWMKRPDLPEGYDGWQAVDGTPQEKSQGIFRCGPASVKAIKYGEVNHDYDTMFLFSAVNADKVYWVIEKVNGKNTYVKYNEEFKEVGKKIITKAVGKDTYEDIKDEYKFPEDSEEERKAMETALSHVKGPTCAAEQVLKSFRASIELGLEEVEALLPGQPIDLNIVVKNKSADAQIVNLSASSHLESYIGKVEASLSTLQQTVQTEGKTVIRIPLKIPADAYMKVLSLTEDELLVKVNIFADVQETNEKLIKPLALSFQYPHLKVVMPKMAKVHEKFTCELIFKNILPIPLENCKLLVEDLDISLKIFDHGVLLPGGTATSKIECAAKKIGDQMIVAKWNSTQVKGITAVKFIEITE
ncbi:protein-glutamine gamma-glutamyltransferase 4-like [Sceloporus undulatus]|uniref:protein-glutamine gamma-glutamyltransferase 4-like n=1 Tax=Sceloporus undulatus TaxID=8520 RepID=UPI001C4BD915|nr:protein-glutamine gamma-glutamyltransferase 4-like [Sceloporus undulatus]XP_042329321.1 protein-glutamine gamma-glutamyltransferase 4-like [Sceloporus undulatus]XP_042329322.1 protein-glutamine gamma-glutamyltransferase 4-like [Sceloporus undulatus]